MLSALISFVKLIRAVRSITLSQMAGFNSESRVLLVVWE